MHSHTQGLAARKNCASKKRGEVFFLDIPFYRTRLFMHSTECNQSEFYAGINLFWDYTDEK